VHIEGAWLLVYELHVQSRSPIELTSLDVNTTPIDLQSRVTRLDDAHAVIYLEVPASALPARVRHELAYESGSDTRRVQDDGVAVQAPPSIALAAPLRGGPWVAVYSPAWPRGHRRVFYDAGGRQVLPGRFAIDYVRVDDQGHIARGDENRVVDHYAYGEPVLAVADGRIVAVRSDAGEPATLDARVKHSVADAAGNYIVLELPDRQFAIYEHLRPGSIKVGAGDRVRAGQALAEVGFTGDSTGPHLHLHVCATATPIGEGVAYHLERFTLLGHYIDIARLGKARWQERLASLAASRRRERPAPNSVLRFGA
jgi:hypothetical protein